MKSGPLNFSGVVLLLLLQVTLQAAGNLIVAAGMRRRPVVVPRVILGTTCLAFSFGIFAWLLQWVDLSVMAPAGASSYLLVTILSRLILREQIPWLRWTGTFLLAAGVLLVLLTSQAP